MQENKSKINLISLVSVFFVILLLVLAFYIYSNKKITAENKNIETSKIINTKEEKRVSETEESSKATSSISENTISKTVKIKADVWADNWFAFYVGDKLIKEDSVSINTEKSFNKESFIFEATYPLQFNFVVKDYKANDTGLEYIGTERQQMGDGGLIAQFTNAETGELIAVTDSNWKSKVIHSAPLDTACEKNKNPVAGTAPCTYKIITEPSDWKSANFDDSLWSKASTFLSTEVGPKGGYDEISWDKKAKFIWGPDLHKDNTILMRLKIDLDVF